MAQRICPGCKAQPAEYLKRAKKWLCEPCALARGFLVKCQGEAHSNPHIDHCGVCMPRWGVHEVANVADIEAQIARLDDQARGDLRWILKNQPPIEGVWNNVVHFSVEYDRLYRALAARKELR